MECLFIFNGHEVNPYLVIAVAATAVFLLQFVMSVFFGGLDMDVDTDADVDADVDTDGGMDASSLFSFKGVINFLMGFGWCKYLFGGEGWASFVIPVFVGVGLMILVFFVYYFAFKLQKVRKPEEPQQLVGRTGTIYNNLGGGRYIIQVERDGALRELEVSSMSGNADLPTMSKVTILETDSGNFFIS